MQNKRAAMENLNFIQYIISIWTKDEEQEYRMLEYKKRLLTNAYWVGNACTAQYELKGLDPLHNNHYHIDAQAFQNVI